MLFVSFRRYYLDMFLSRQAFSGDVLDVGGKKNNKHGNFVPPVHKVKSWRYVNIDKDTLPDLLCSADKICLEDSSIDVVLMTELIEHLQDPEAALKEAFRLLRKNGTVILSVPFLYGIHADPYDYQRWTAEKIKIELKKIGYKDEKIVSMGGIIAVVWDLTKMYCKKKGFLTYIIEKLIRLFVPVLKIIDGNTGMKERITTGYYVTARK